MEHEIIMIIIITGISSTASLAKRSRRLSELPDDVCLHVVLGSVQEQCDVAAKLSKVCKQVRVRIMPLAMPVLTSSAASRANLSENTSVELHDETTASSTTRRAPEAGILEPYASPEELPETAIGQQSPCLLWACPHKRPTAASDTAFEKEDQLRKISREVA